MDKRVLIVDDDPVALALLAHHLENGGYTVIQASSGHDALRIMLDEAPPLVVTDWEMPDINGLDLCRAIRAHEGVGFVYVVILAGHTSPDRLVEAFEAGADDYVGKPCNPRELLARLRAGERIVTLEGDLARRTREVFKYNAEMEIANRKLGIANEKLERMATTDELTGLVNRRAAMQRMDEQWSAAGRHGTPLSFIAVDIDHFKNFNDAHGHAVGDRVLKATAEHLRQAARAEDVVCRIGGEEFLVLCPNSDTEGAHIAGERLRKVVQEMSLRNGSNELRVTISAGVAAKIAGMNGPDDVLKAADEALYAAKRRGRNCVVVHSPAIAADASGDGQNTRPISRSSTTDALTHVLLIDRNANTRNTYAAMLTRDGYSVRTAANIREAAGLITDTAPDIVVMAVAMSDSELTAWIAQVREDAATADTSIIVLRDASRATVVDDEAGADDYLVHPISARDFLMRMRTMTRLCRSRREGHWNNELRGEQTRKLSLLLDLSRTVASADDLETVLEGVLVTSAELTCSRRVSVLLPTLDSNHLVVAKSLGIGRQIAERMRVPIGEAVSGDVYVSRRSRSANVPEDWEGISRGVDGACFADGPLVSVPLYTSKHMVGVLNIAERHDERTFDAQDLEFIDLVATIAASAIQDILIRRSRDELRDSIVVALAKLAERRDDDTGKHLDRVSKYCVYLALELSRVSRYCDKIDDTFLRDLERSVPLHDIGKVAIPDAILLKPGKLTVEEMAIMRTHAEIGAETIHSVRARAPGTRFLEMAEDIAHAHHEWYDGSGYPRGLRAEAIPLAARIVALADVYDALTSDRVYRKAMTHADAVRLITERCGTQFDPALVSAFKNIEGTLAQLATELADAPGLHSIPDDALMTKLPITPPALAVASS